MCLAFNKRQNKKETKKLDVKKLNSPVSKLIK